MKKANFVFFIPAILVALFYTVIMAVSGDLIGAKQFFILAVLFASAVLPCMGKPWGSMPAIAYFAVTMVADYIRNYPDGWRGFGPEYIYCIPAIVFYIGCSVYVAVKNIQKKRQNKE